MDKEVTKKIKEQRGRRGRIRWLNVLLIPLPRMKRKLNE